MVLMMIRPGRARVASSESHRRAARRCAEHARGGPLVRLPDGTGPAGDGSGAARRAALRRRMAAREWRRAALRVAPRTALGVCAGQPGRDCGPARPGPCTRLVGRAAGRTGRRLGSHGDAVGDASLTRSALARGRCAAGVRRCDGRWSFFAVSSQATRGVEAWNAGPVGSRRPAARQSGVHTVDDRGSHPEGRTHHLG